jgi:NADPH2:quinone reductase
MKAIYCVKYGTHHDLEIRDIPAPGEPLANQVSVRLDARGIQFSDLVKFAGNYQVESELPFIVGGEAAGTITAVGDGVDYLNIGDSVLCTGGCVEKINIEASKVTQLPAGADLIKAASFMNNYATAYYGLQRAQLQPGETLLVLGAGGGVSLAAVDLGKLFGARVIGAASTDEKLAVVSRMGADDTINYSDGFKDQVKAMTDGLGADVIYDPVGGDTFAEAMRCVAPFGRILIVGFTSGRAALAKTNHLLVKDAAVIGYSLGGVAKYKPELLKRNAATLLDWLGNGRINPFVSHVFPMDDIKEAYQQLVDRKVIGKVIIAEPSAN